MNKKDNPLLNMKVDASLAATRSSAPNGFMTDDEKRRMRRNALLKMLAMLIFIVCVIVFSSIAWFTSNKDNSATGMGVTAKDAPFDLKAVGNSSGLYDDEYMSAIIAYDNSIGSYSDSDQSSGAAPNIKLKLTPASGNEAAYDMQNLYTDNGTPDLKDITKHESESYGLNPKDFGRLQFQIVPRYPDSEITVNFKLKLSCYQIGYDASEEFEKQFDENGVFDPDDVELTKVTDANLLKLLSGHIVFFYINDNNQPVLIDPLSNNGTSITLSQTKTVTIYWAWPENLRNILSAQIDGITSGASSQVQALFMAHPDLFLKDISDTDTTAITGSTASAILNGSDYTRYSAKYNNADQDIGDNIKYIMLEIVATTG